MPPTPLTVAIKAVEVWLGSPRCEMIGEGPGYFDGLQDLLKKGKVTGPPVHDARITAQEGLQRNMSRPLARNSIPPLF